MELFEDVSIFFINLKFFMHCECNENKIIMFHLFVVVFFEKHWNSLINTFILTTKYWK